MVEQSASLEQLRRPAMPTYLVTGSNRGIGLEYCRQLEARGDQVIALCRTPSQELEALGVRLEAGIELTAEPDLDALLQLLAGQPLDGWPLAIDLRPRGIAVALLHPGLVRTRMVNFNPQGISPEEAVRGLLARIDALSLATSGGFWHANGTLLPW